MPASTGPRSSAAGCLPRSTGWCLCRADGQPCQTAMAAGRCCCWRCSGWGWTSPFSAVAPTLFYFVGRVLAGICGSSWNQCLYRGCDPPEGRARAFAMMGAALSVGFVIGPAIEYWANSARACRSGWRRRCRCWFRLWLVRAARNAGAAANSSGRAPTLCGLPRVRHLSRRLADVPAGWPLFLLDLGLSGDLVVLGSCQVRLERRHGRLTLAMFGLVTGAFEPG